MNIPIRLGFVIAALAGAMASAAPNSAVYNLSTRGRVATDDGQSLIAGFVIEGEAPLKLAVRGLGPTLQNFGLSGTAQNAEVSVFAGSTVLHTNDSWRSCTEPTSLISRGIQPGADSECTAVVTLNPGSYTAIVRDKGTGGTGLVDIFAIDDTSTSRLTNVSTRGFVGTDSQVLIAGLIVTEPCTVLLRGQGPNLANFGLTGVVPNPKITLYSGQTVLASNDSWADGNAASRLNSDLSSLRPAYAAEPALLADLQPGAYTAILEPAPGSSTGIGLVEVFDVTPPTPIVIAPAITAQPASITVTAGATATFSVTASGTEPLTYQWFRNGTAVTNGTNRTYTTNSLSTADSGAILSVVVSNSAGSVTSASATLTVNESISRYDPSWSGIMPTITTAHNYNSAQSVTQNGAALVTALNSLNPGQRFLIKAGTYSINSYYNFTRSGTAEAPIWIEGEPGVVITRPDAGQNIINIGYNSPVAYVCFRNLEFTGGSLGIRFYSCSNVWLDRCHIHHTGEAGISTNTANTSFMHITRNEVDHTGGTGEGMYLGANNGAVIMSRSVIALNHVHHTNGPSVSQGDGIELKQGSWGNLIAENHVHDCNYPCILVYGTAGQPSNIVERNVCYNSKDNTLQIQGECIVRNNLIMNGASAAFASTDHQGTSINLQVVHNTIVNPARAMNLSSWNNRSGMILANNVVYSQSANSIRFPNGSAGVTLAGNVVFGPVSGASAGFVSTTSAATPLADFQSVTWTATSRDARPTAGCSIVGAGNASHAVATDITGNQRTSALESGCYDAP